MWLLALCLGARAAPVVLGPDGPLWLGPFGPSAPTDLTLVVDPEDGTLYVEDGPRVLSGGSWTLRGEPLTEASPGVVWDEAGRVEATQGESRRRFLYDGSGRLSGLLTSDGDTIQVRYDPTGRIGELAGPGLLRWRFHWLEDGVEATDTAGQTWTVTFDGAGHVKVKDPLAREVRSSLDAAGRLVAFTDPVGGETALRWQGEAVEVRTRTGRTLRLLLGPGRRPLSLDLGDGLRWLWQYDDLGRLVTITDPAGRTATWTRDGAGRVVATRFGRTSIQLERNAEGKVKAIVDGAGAVTRLVRDGAGALTSIEDPSGGRITLIGERAGIVSELVTRRNGQISFGFDVLGRIADVLDPVGQRISIVRDSASRLVRIVDQIYGETRIDRALDGRITRVKGADGRTLGLVRTLSGQLREVIRPDGTSMVLERDARGDVVGVRQGATLFAIARDADGRPTDVGPLAWKWDGIGRVDEVSHQGAVLRFRRDGAGRIQRITAGRHWVEIERDEAGTIVRWSGTDGTVELVRDARGQIASESVQVADRAPTKVQLSHDPRGWVDRIDLGDLSWGIDREPGGAPLRVQGPSSLRIGRDVDALGRLVLVRYPSGALGRFDYRGSTVLEDIDGPDGTQLRAVAYELDTRGRVLSALDVGGQATQWRYGPLGEIVAIEGPEGAWSWTPDGFVGPAGEVLVSDEYGRAAEARPPAWPHAWSVSEETMSVRRDAWGRMLEIAGERGTAELVYDGFGRLTDVRGTKGSSWRLAYDARGRVASVRTADGRTLPFAWSPDGDLLSSGERVWVGDALGLVGMAEGEARAEIVRDRWGDPVALGLNGEPMLPHRISPTGYPSSDASGLAGPGTLLQLFAGGPLLAPGVALDPVSGQRVDGWTGWPWAPRAVRGEPDNDHLDPAPWASTSAWTDPLALLIELGVVVPPTDEPTVRLFSPEPPMVGLPAALDGGDPPLGPPLDGVPVGLGPIGDVVIGHLLRAAGEVTPDEVVAVLLADQIALDWLPPDIEVPGLERWRDRAPDTLRK